jgi:hypothetical protein
MLFFAPSEDVKSKTGWWHNKFTSGFAGVLNSLAASTLYWKNAFK